MTPQPGDPNRLPRTRRYRIIVGVDLSRYSDIVIEQALDQAARHAASELHFVTVREKTRPASDDLDSLLWDRVNPALEAFSKHGTNWRARLHVRSGKPCEEMAELAAEVRGDLIVIGQFGLHSSGASHNNVPNRVLQATGCPTLIVGMPQDADSPSQCTMCVDVRETTDGEHWYCADHAHSNRKLEQTCTPMMTWTSGILMGA